VLVELTVENYAVVERAKLRFHRGLNVLTGETGSGKSIVVDSLALLFGGRAAADVVRSGAAGARVAAIFEAPRAAGARAVIEEAGIEVEDGELLVEREILASGKSRAFAGGRGVTASVLRALAPWLGDIHGQNEQQQLFLPAFQLALLDASAGTPVQEVRNAFREWRACKEELAALDRAEQERLRLADLWSFQRREIEEAAPTSGEDVSLEAERQVLKNITRLQELAGAAYDSLYDAPGSAFVQLRTAMRRIEELARIDGSLAPLEETLAGASIAVEEVSRTLGDYLARLEADPARLDAVESRLAALEKLKRKYGPDLAGVLAFLENVRRQLAAAEDAGERRAEIGKRLEKLSQAFRGAAGRLTEARRKAAGALEARMQEELAALSLKGAVFRVALGEAEWSEQGTDRVEFLLSANAGEEARPLDRVASGGELSRIALALKTCAAAKAPPGETPRTLVFDEVDAGIGGSVADTLGRRLKRLAERDQILCVTHLAQVASFADHHFVVEKREAGGRTVAEVAELSPAERTREIGRMLSGEQVTPEALKHAEQMIRRASRSGS
jgi:DNA repair protein RecN (Recombination protein N)